MSCSLAHHTNNPCGDTRLDESISTSKYDIKRPLSAEEETFLDGFVGVWKLQKNENFEEYLRAQGVGVFLRTILKFLDFSVKIERKKRGLKICVHDYESQFSVGELSPLLEHPVTKKTDQLVLVLIERSRLVVRIFNPDYKSTSNPKAVETLTLELFDNNNVIKHKLQVAGVTCYRWYGRESALATLGANASSSKQTAAAANGKMIESKSATKTSEEEKKSNKDKEQNDVTREVSGMNKKKKKKKKSKESKYEKETKDEEEEKEEEKSQVHKSRGRLNLQRISRLAKGRDNSRSRFSSKTNSKISNNSNTEKKNRPKKKLSNVISVAANLLQRKRSTSEK